MYGISEYSFYRLNIHHAMTAHAWPRQKDWICILAITSMESFMKLVAFVPPHRRMAWTLELGQYFLYVPTPLLWNTKGIKGLCCGCEISLVWVLANPKGESFNKPIMGDAKLCLFLLLSTLALTCKYISDSSLKPYTCFWCSSFYLCQKKTFYSYYYLVINYLINQSYKTNVCITVCPSHI